VRRFLCDTNVLVYAVGAPHPYREACRAIVARQGDGVLSGEVTSVVIAEFAHQRFRQVRDRQEASVAARQVGAAFRVHALGEGDAELALDLFAGSQSLDAFDALLAATALNRGVDVVLSADRAFDAVEGIERVDPLDERAVESLG
jgi:predicted nucleic acid-binding protein